MAGVVVAGQGNDLIQTGPFADNVYAGLGKNSVISPGAADVVSGNVTLNQDVSELEATHGSGTINYIYAPGRWDDVWEIKIYGTPFKDTCIVTDSSVWLNGVRYDIGAYRYTFYGFDGDDKFIFRAESYQGGNAYGGNGNDFLSSYDYQMELMGESGDDILHLTDGGSCDGGIGNDTFRLQGGIAFGGDGDDIFRCSVTGCFIYGQKGDDVVFGGPGDDTIFGGTGRDLIYGGGGDDNIDSGILRDGHTVANPDGGDMVFGGSGNDLIESGWGNDEVFGGDGDDTILSGPDDDRVVGGPGNDTVTLGAGNDYATGGAGDDIISGNAGDDTIFGNSGNNTLTGGPGDDFIR